MTSINPRVRILLVDDNESNLLALETILQGPDRDLMRASSGEEALRYLLDHDVAVILLDVQMPSINGFETAALIRARERSRNTPIIFVTAHDSAGDSHVAEGYSLGAVDYIVKPLNPDALRSKVAVFVELFRKTEQVRQQAEILREKNLQLEYSNLQRLSKMVTLGQELTAEHDPSRLLAKFCRGARDIVGAEYAAVLLNDGKETDRFLSCATDDSVLADQPSDEVLRALAARITNAASLRMTLGSESDAIRLLPGRLPLYSLLAAHLPAAERMEGWLYLGNKIDADEFSEADERLAIALAGQVAVSYENARLHAEALRYAIALEQEVAERKQAEEERSQMLEREQSALAEVTMRMDQMAQLNDELKRSNAELDSFAYIASHDLKEPLRGIHNYSFFLLEDYNDTLDEQGRQYLLALMKLTRRMETLIESLLHYSRVGRAELALSEIRLQLIVEETLELLSARLREGNVEVQVPRPLPEALVDQARMGEVFSNLIANAIKYNDKPEKRVEIGYIDVPASALSPQSQEDSQAADPQSETPDSASSDARKEEPVVFYVKDNGIGIADRHRESIFRIFKRLHGRDEYGGGTGAGLTIARKIIERHGGRIWVESTPGEGSIFYFTLPKVNEHTGRAGAANFAS